MKNHVLWIVLFASLALTGCGGPEVNVSGILVENGKPVMPIQDEEITISFIAEDAEASVPIAAADYDPADGSFKLRGPVREGIPPGAYKVVVTGATGRESAPDRFRGAFSEEQTPLRCTVTTAPTQELIIDLTARTVREK